MLLRATRVGDLRRTDGVEIGPYAVIGPDVEIGPGTSIGAHTVVTGHTRLGAGNRSFHLSSIGEAPLGGVQPCRAAAA